MMARMKQWLAPPVFDSEKDNRTAYLLNIISISYLIILSSMTTLGILQGGISNINNETFVVLANRVLPLFVTFTIAQILMRRGKLKTASYAYIILLWLSYVWGIWQYGGIEASTLANFVLIVLVAGLLVGNRGVTVFSGLSVFIILLTLILQNQGFIQTQEIPAIERVIAVTLNLILSAVYLSLYIRSLDEALNKTETANVLLEESKENLESRIAERTKDLKLASEISRVLAQITDVENLLQESVGTIRAQFDFYYVQIYLADDLASTLTLQAGTGDVGQELVRRGHRLVIGPGSINGAAAADKKAVIVSDTATNPLFRPNTFLPLTRSEMAVPLIIGEQVVGVLDLQSAKPNEFSQENLPAYNVLAGQLAVAIENAKLLDETAAARAEVESYTRRITREGWSSYLDAVEHPRFLGFSYDEEILTPLNSPLTQDLSNKNVAQVPIDIIGETVGAIQVEADLERIWTTEDLDLIQTVATQVGQQVEMLRALDQAAQYRQEAERALRRVTHEAWLTYEESPDLSGGFAYDQVEVKPVTAVSSPTVSSDVIHHELSLHGETIGELALVKPENTDEEITGELVTAVASQLIAHMENLRLTEQTEKALAETQRRGYELTVINRVVSRVSQAISMQDSMQIIVDELVEATGVDQVRVALLDGQNTKLSIIAEKFDDTINESALGLAIPLADNTLTQEVLNTKRYIFIDDVQSSSYTEAIQDMLAEQHIHSLLVMPIIIDDVVIGTVGLDILDDRKTITSDQIRLAETLILQAATAIQKAQLFEETEARAEELAVINEVAQITAKQSDRQKLIQTVKEQIQRVVDIDAFFIAIYDEENDLIEYPYIYDDGSVYRTPPEPPSRSSWVYEVLQTGQPILKNRTQEEIDELSNQQEITRIGDVQRVSASLLYIPLLTGRETLGVLSIQSYQLNAFNEANITLLSGIGNHVAVALENMRLLTETRQSAEREQLLRTISATINTSIDAESVLQTAAREIGRAIGAETYVYLTPTLNMAKSATASDDNSKKIGNGTTP